MTDEKILLLKGIRGDLDTCSCGGCEIDPRYGEVIECQFPHCKNTHTCVGCAYECGKCKRDFCENHIEQIRHGMNDEFGVTVCFLCLDEASEAITEGSK